MESPFFDFIFNLPLPFFNGWSYSLIFTLTWLEGMPFGFLIPGQAILVFSGFLAKLKIIGFFNTLWIAGLGAVLGDFFSYFIGRRYGLRFIIKYGRYFFFKKEYFDKTKKLLNEHTGKTLILGRFNSITRSFAPIIAGISEVPFKKFAFYNITGGLGWVAFFVLTGFLVGRWYQMVAKHIGTIVIAAVIIGVFMIYLYKFLNQQRHIFLKYDLGLLIINIFSLAVFFKIAEDISKLSRVVHLDIAANQAILLCQTPALNKIMPLVTQMLSLPGIILISSLLFIFLLSAKRFSNIIVLFGSLGGGLLISFSAKIIFHRLRPENSLIAAGGFSFPSSHAVAAAIFFILLVYFFKNDIKNLFLKIAFILSAAFVFSLVAFSRFYLNIHWLSDVIAGIALGVFWTSLVILVIKYTAEIVKMINNKQPPRE